MSTKDDRGVPWVARRVVLVATLTVLMTVVVVVQQARDRKYEAYRVETQTLYIPSGAVLQRLALSFDSLLADVYWIRAVQHFGRTRSSEDPRRSYELLYPLLDIATTLDPRFNMAYRFGAIFLAEAHPGGPGQPSLAVALLEKGAREMPERWQYPQDIGFVYYWWLHDYGEAARWFQRASEVPGAPWWLKSLAANTLALGGNRTASRMLWQQMLATADNGWMRAESERRLLQLEALDQIDSYVQAIEAFVARHGRLPGAWRDVVTRGQASEGPVDPAGYPYSLDPRSGSVSVSPQSPLFPLPDEPRATMLR